MSERKFDSKEEEQYADWCDEAVEWGLLNEWEYQPPSWLLTTKATVTIEKQLKTKVKMIEKTIYQSHSYTCDMRLVMSELGLRAFAGVFPTTYLADAEGKLFSQDDTVMVDVKGDHQSYDGGRSFSINQKLMYWFYKIVIEKVVPWKSQRDRKGKPKKTNKDGTMKANKCFFMDTFCPDTLRYQKNGELSAMGRNCPTVEEFVNGIKETK